MTPTRSSRTGASLTKVTIADERRMIMVRIAIAIALCALALVVVVPALIIAGRCEDDRG